ncbi:hypothetical protein [Streptomyces canus]|uniref:hypothetical protein n=1 Tax=Streptomyces canus TaxID=58343 RepID=UPI0033A7EBBA
MQLADNAHDVLATATLDSPIDDWFDHPAVGPALTAAMTSGLTEQQAPPATVGDTDALRLLSSTAMRQYLGFLPSQLPQGLLEKLMEMSEVPSAQADF